MNERIPEDKESVVEAGTLLERTQALIVDPLEDNFLVYIGGEDCRIMMNVTMNSMLEVSQDAGEPPTMHYFVGSESLLALVQYILYSTIISQNEKLVIIAVQYSEQEGFESQH